MKRLLKRGLLGIAKRSRLVTNVAAYITHHTSVQGMHAMDSYGFFRERFIGNGKNHAVNEAQRERLAQKFERIDQEVPIASTPTDGLFLDAMVSQP